MMWICPDCGRSFKRTNQSHYCGKAPATIDEYISKQPQGIQPFLVELRNVIHQAIPEAQETISWSVPAWKRKNSNVIRFSVNKDHIGLYIEDDAIARFEERLQSFETGKGVIRLKRDQALPSSLIADMAKWSYSKV